MSWVLPYPHERVGVIDRSNIISTEGLVGKNPIGPVVNQWLWGLLVYAFSLHGWSHMRPLGLEIWLQVNPW